MKNKLLTLAAALTLAGIISGITAAPAIAQAVIKAVLVKNVDEPGRVPFMRSLSCSTTSTNSCSDASIFVRANTRLVVEHFSMLNRAANAMRVPEGIFVTGATSFKSRAFVKAEVSDAGPTTSRYILNEPLHFYADAGEVINITVNYHNVGVSDNDFTITGYLVDLRN